MRIPTTAKLERQTTYIQKIIDQTEYSNLTKMAKNIFDRDKNHEIYQESKENE